MVRQLTLALLLAASALVPLAAQTPAAAGGTRKGAAGTRANGNPPTAGANASSAQPSGGSPGAPAGGGDANTSQPRPDANAKIEDTGYPTTNPKASEDHPLLPIASLGNALGIRSRTPIQVNLARTVDSGHAHNGDMLDGTLAMELPGLPKGTPVRLTVVQASPAGRMTSYGELSVQVVSIGQHRVLSDTITAEGKEGKKDQPDSAPAPGTEAVFNAGQVLSLPAA